MSESDRDLINEGLDEVLGVATMLHPAGDETLTQCRLCDEFEGHTDECPMPWIDHWLAEGKEENARIAGNVRHVQRMINRARRGA